MLEHLFGSKTRLKLLKVFFRKPDTLFYVRELTRILEVQINAIRRELDLLVQSGMVKEMENNDKSQDEISGAHLRKYYALNKESILYEEMRALLTKAQMIGEQQFVSEILEKAGDIKLFIVTGHFTGDKKAPIDIMLVGDIKEITFSKIIKKYEKEFGFDVRYTLMTESEFADRRHVMDKFLFSIFEAGHTKILNKLSL